VQREGDITEKREREEKREEERRRAIDACRRMKNLEKNGARCVY
jgi:hypothetical protein